MDVLALFDGHAVSQPEAVALEAGPERWSYADVAARSERLARRLAAAGAAEERLVGLLLDDPRSVAIALLASWRAGAAVLPISPADPPRRLTATLQDSAPRLVVVDRSNAPQLPPTVPTIDLDGPVGDAPALPPRRPRGGRLAYAIYTSGSTGHPKAALLEHRGLTDLAEWMREGPLRVSPGDRVLQWATPTVDAFMWEVVMALACGATLVCLPDRGDLQQVAAQLRNTRISVATLTPSVWRHLPAEAISELRVAISAGEACPPEVGNRLRSHAGLFVNAYGPTETTICATAATAPDDPRSIGVAVAGATVALSTEPDDAGEILIGGSGVARGYLGRPRLTAERFVPDPTSEVPGARRYRSGDRGADDGAGGIWFAGRADDQVKIRGFRVELAEVEHALTAHPDVAEAAATVRGCAEATHLVGFVALRDGAASDARAIRAHMRDIVPAHMVPARVHVLEAMPLTEWGKIDRRALVEPEGDRAVAPMPVAVAGTEARVLEVWRGVLGRPVAGVDEDFFDIGGDSLLAMRVVGELRRTDAPQLTLRNLFENPTVKLLAMYIDGLRDDARR